MTEKRDIRNSQDSQDRFSGAMKIFEALSGLDEELLERSEEPFGVHAKRKVIPFTRYSRLIAACACLLVVVGGVYAGTRFGIGPYGTLQTEKAEAVCEDVTLDEEMEQNAAPAEGTVPKNVEELQEMIPENVVNDEKGLQEKAGNVGEQEEAAVEEKTEFAHVKDGMASRSEFISEEEARAMETVGAYVPRTFPTGYQFESAHRIEEDGITSGVGLCWTRGIDDIMIWIYDTKVDTSQEKFLIADISKPKTYDVRLYEIPYADTVPEEYREIFEHPVFAEQDLSLNIVKSRMKISDADSGDTDTPRGMFSVLYDDGILVKFNGRGSAEEIWEMFESVQNSVTVP